MDTQRGLNTCHPFVSFFYFAAVIIFAMVFLHPLFGLVSLASAVGYAVCQKGKKAILFFLRFPLPLLGITVFMNLLANNVGQTILFYWPWGKAATLESFVYGFALGLMAVSAMLWFYGMDLVFRSDKTKYLFSGAAPHAGLMLSMIFHLIPSLEKRTKQITEGQAALGLNAANKTFALKLRYATLVLSALTSWALEDAMERADSMRARGYGKRRKTVYTPYVFSERDRRIVVILFILSAVLVTGAVFKAGTYSFQLGFSDLPVTSLKMLMLGVYGLLCLFPMALLIWEGIRWNILQLKI